MAMSHSRWQQMMRSVPTNARKLYELIPIGEAWSYLQIHQEALRIGLNMPHTTVMGCVGELKDAGLVYEPSLHRFQRCPHKPPSEPITITPKTEPTTVANNIPTPIKTRAGEETRQSAVDRIGAVAAQLRQLAKGFADVADDLDHIAIDIEQRAETNAKAAEELARIRDTFKTLGLGGGG